MSPQPLPVGEELRRAREEAGLDLADVAAHLRIRSNFLSALEEGRPDALPGITYAIGYVRTYAAFLGLDPEAAVRRFKEEAASLNAKTQLVFPSPAPEGRVPGLVLMLVAAALVGGAYGGWYWVSERDGSLRDLVPAVPERLAQLIEGDTPALPPVPSQPNPNVTAGGSYADANPAGVTLPRSAPSGTTPAPASSVDAEAQPGTERTAALPTPPARDDAAPAGPDAAPAASPAATPSAATPSAAAPASPDSAATASVDTAASPATPSAATPSATTPSSASSAPADGERAAAPETVAATADETPDVTDPPESASQTAAAGPAAASSAADSAAGSATPGESAANSASASVSGADSDVPAAPRIAGLIGASEAAVPSGQTTAGPIDRVMIRATGDSWVQVRDAQGTALFTRVLREGDVYRVPDQTGLRLATGNAGALEILVDGDPAPSLGGFGEVVRNVMLDPGRLAAGTAAGGSR